MIDEPSAIVKWLLHGHIVSAVEEALRDTVGVGQIILVLQNPIAFDSEVQIGGDGFACGDASSLKDMSGKDSLIAPHGVDDRESSGRSEFEAFVDLTAVLGTVGSGFADKPSIGVTAGDGVLLDQLLVGLLPNVVGFSPTDEGVTLRS